MLAETRGANGEALKQYDAALAISPTGQEPLNAAVQLLMRGNRAAEALVRLDRVIVGAPEDAYALNLRGEVLAAQKKVAEAGDAFAAASRAAPQWWIPSRNRALVLIQQKDVDGAIALMRSEAARLGQPEPLVGELTGLLIRLGRFEDAIAGYDELLKKQPASLFAANNLAMLLVTHHSDAASLKRAGELVAPLAQSRNADLLDTSGWVQLKLGHFAEAIPLLEKATASSPDASVIRYHLALAQFAAGQKETARANLERALQSKQEFDGIVDARAKLTEWKQAG
jgi:tetratricopeptide (TPR) repeat protein